MTAPFRLRRSEWLLIAYFCYTAILAIILPVRPPVPILAAGMNVLVITGFLILAAVEPVSRGRLLPVLRDWYPLPLATLAYREMGWFAPAEHTYALEQGWVVWDRMLLDGWGLKAAIESLGPLLPSLLEISYSLVYTMPVISVALLYSSGHRKRVEPFLLTFLMGALGAYVLFPLFPSEPPRTVFPGELFPAYDTPFRRLNFWFLGGQGIRTSVFPSAHVSASFASALAIVRLLPERRWAGRLLLILATLIATATIYGRYHYAVDALAGFGLAVLAEGIGRRLDR